MSLFTKKKKNWRKGVFPHGEEIEKKASGAAENGAKVCRGGKRKTGKKLRPPIGRRSSCQPGGKKKGRAFFGQNKKSILVVFFHKGMTTQRKKKSKKEGGVNH